MSVVYVVAAIVCVKSCLSSAGDDIEMIGMLEVGNAMS